MAGLNGPTYITNGCPMPIDGGLYRASTAPNVYLYAAGELHEIPDIDTLAALQFNYGQVVVTSLLCLDAMGYGTALPSIHNANTLGGVLAAINSFYVAPLTGQTTPGYDATTGAILPSAGPSTAVSTSLSNAVSGFGSAIANNEQKILLFGGIIGAFYLGIPQGLMRSLKGSRY